MDRQIYTGQTVTLRSALGNVEKSVVGVRDGIVVVTSADEYRRAKMERREPLSVGFPLADVVSVGVTGGVGRRGGGDPTAPQGKATRRA